MLKLALPAAALAICVPLSAQEDHFTSSPQGFEGVEGNLAIDLIGREALLRYQQVDAFTYGEKGNRNRIAFRRDGLLPSNPTYGARVIEMEFGHGEGNLGTMSTTFSNNYSAVSHQVVITKKQISFPDWSAAPALPPATNSEFIIATDVVGWGYPGRSVSGTDFVWEVKVWSNNKAGTSYPFDGDTVIPTSLGSSGATVGAGCTATGGASAVSYHLNMANSATSFDLDMDVGNCESGQAAFGLLGGAQSTQNIGFCTPLELVPTVVVSMGTTDPTGFAQIAFPGLTYNAALIGQNIYGQAVAFDSGQGLVLSNGRDLVVPANPPVGTQVKHMFALDPNAATATSGILTGGIILLTNHP